ncbi:MAG: hypothetical protein ACT4NV_11010 [Rhodoferax sp.]
MVIFRKNPPSQDMGFPSLKWEDDELPTRPMPLHERPLQARIDHEMATVGQRHPRIADAIEKFWGHRDCVEYLQTLIVQGFDGEQRQRAGFKPEVSAALIQLVALHKTAFPEV